MRLNLWNNLFRDGDIMEEILRLQCMIDELLPQLQEVAKQMANEMAKHNRNKLRIVATNPQTNRGNDDR